MRSITENADGATVTATAPREQSPRRRKDDVRGGRGPKLLSAQDAAKYLGVPYTTLRDWVLRGHLPVVRAPESGRMWFDRDDLDRAVKHWKE